MLTSLIEQVFRQTLSGFAERLADFMPNLLAMVIILVLGLLVAGFIRYATAWTLRRLGFDRFAEGAGLNVTLRQSGITSPPSSIVAVLLGWSVLAVFVLLAIGALNLQFAMDLLSRAFLYLPQFLIALALLALGGLASGFVRRSVLIAAVNAGLPSARLLAAGAQAAVFILVAAMALEHVGVGRQILLVSFTILFGGVVLALALSFGLAGRELAREFLDRIVRRAPEAGDREDPRSLL